MPVAEAAERWTIPCGAITLDARWHPVAAPRGGVVVCHPHPLYGGSMDNNVVYAVVEALNAADIAALRFNFRGVGRSGGQHGGGTAEREDVAAALAALAEQLPAGSPLGVAGYSFGAAVGLAAGSQAPHVAALAGISPPLVAGFGYDFLSAFAHPILLIAGDRDDFVPPDRLEALGQSLPNTTARVIPGVDHFWFDREDALREAVGEFFARAFAGENSGFSSQQSE